MNLGKVLRFLRLVDRESEAQLKTILQRREALDALTDDEIRIDARSLREKPDLVETFALAAVVAERVLNLRLFDVQIQGALALARGDIAEMQTGEGKTLAAVPAVIWYALGGRGVHVLTANDYLARRDAHWMGPIYEWFGLSVGHLSQSMTAGERRAAYNCGITYATANEVGFDYLRDGLARSPGELVQRPFRCAVIDEADSILIDEARIPLVIAGGTPDDPALAHRVEAVVRHLRPGFDYYPDEFARNVQLTDEGIRRVEVALACESLFDERSLLLLTAVQNALHARALLRRDVDYVVKNGAVELVDEFKGRIAQNRRWPAGLQSALEAKEGVPLKQQGRILGSITVQNLVGLYERVCGMTGTAATQAEEFWKVYKLPVTVIPTNRPVIREDLPDIVYADREARNRALEAEIRKVHATGRPVLVGTASVAESEALSVRLLAAGIPHSILNARNHEAEAEVIAQAGALGAVTISTNMAGRGTDILLGGNPPRDREQVVALGGLYVIGTTRHEARRIDHQLSGRAGRQGDPGSSRFFLSLDDELVARFATVKGDPDIGSAQRVAEGQNLEIRQTLWKYEAVIEHHRRDMQSLRREVLLSPEWSVASLAGEARYVQLIAEAGQEEVESAGRRLTLAVLDDLWSDYLASVAELRGGVHWVSWGGRDPLHTFVTGVREIYADFLSRLEQEVAAGFDEAEIREGRFVFADESKFERGATWTYLTTDQPFGTLGERIVKGIRRRFSGR
jgi:preprotein translocase subunit SecA